MAAKTNTTLYNWSDDGLIRQIEVRQQSNGHAVAYIEADNGPELHQQRQNIRAAIRLKGWGTLSDHRDGKFLLRVSGLRSGDQLLDMLRAEGFTTTQPSISHVAEKIEKPKGLWEYIKAHSLTISGTIATVGNLMSVASGIHRKDGYGQIGQGAAFALADLPLAIAGERDDSRQLSNLLRGLKKHYEKNGIEIPKNAAIEVETSDKGKSIGQLTQDYLHRYANQIKCSLEVVAAAFTIKAGHDQGSIAKQRVPWIWGSGFLASLLIPEKKIDGEKYEQAGAIERAWMRIQSNPLSIGGLLGYSNTVGTYWSGFDERRRYLYPNEHPTLPNKKTGILKLPTNKYGWDFAIPTVMIGANGTYAISKKTVGGNIDSHEMVSDVYSIAAQILNKQPDDTREGAIQSTAKFLGERPEIKDNHQEIVIRLRKEMDIQRQNPWFEKVGLPPHKPTQSAIASDSDAIHLPKNGLASPLSASLEVPPQPQDLPRNDGATTPPATPATTISGHTLAHEAMSKTTAHQPNVT